MATTLLSNALNPNDQGQLSLQDIKRVTYADLRQWLLDYYSTMKKKSLQTLAGGTETIWGLSALHEFFGHTPEKPSRTLAISITDDTAAKLIRQRRAEGVSDGTIRGSLALLVQMFSRAKSTNKLSNVPEITLPKPPQSKSDFIREPQLDTLLKALPEHLRPFLTFLFYQGTRSGEAAATSWGQIDLNRGTYRPRAAMRKTGEKGVRPLHDKVLSALRTLGRHEPDELVFDTTNLRKSFMKASVALGFSKYAWVCGQCAKVDGSNPKVRATCDDPECSAPRCIGGMSGSRFMASAAVVSYTTVNVALRTRPSWLSRGTRPYRYSVITTSPTYVRCRRRW